MRFAHKLVACAVSFTLALGGVPALAFAAPTSANDSASTAAVADSTDQSAASTDAAAIDEAATPSDDQAADSTQDAKADNTTAAESDQADKAAATEETDADDEAVADEAAAAALAADDEADADDDAATASAQAVSLKTGTALTLKLADTSGVLDIAGASLDNGVAAQIYPSNNTPAQRFRLIKDTETGAYMFVNVKSKKVLDVTAGKATAGTAVQQYTRNNTDAQFWDIEELEDGSYALATHLTSSSDEKLYLTASGSGDSGALTIEPRSLNARQSFKVDFCEQKVEDGLYTINLAADPTLVLDVAGASWSSSANVQLYSSNNTIAQMFQFEWDKTTGYYKIISASSAQTLDVVGASTADSANVQQYPSNSTFAQRWLVGETDNGYVIQNALSVKALDVAAGKLASGTNVQQYKLNGTAAQLWTLTPATIPSGSIFSIHAGANTGYAVDIAGGSTSDYANAQIYSDNGTAAQQFLIMDADSDGYYTIRNVKSGKYLTASGDAGSGANVVQQSLESADGQLWAPTVTDKGIVWKNKAGTVLDIAGAVYSNGTNVQAYKANGTSAQGFLLRGCASAEMGIIDYYTEVSGQIITSTLVNGNPYLFLGSTADVTAVPLLFSSETTGDKAMISAKKATGYTTIVSGDTLNLEDLGCYDSSVGGYVLYVKTSATSPVTKLTIMVSSSVPTMYILSDDPVSEGRAYVEASADHSAKASATMLLLEPDGTVTYGDTSSAITIKGRGNSTWQASAKKPYQIKLDKKTDLLNTGDKDNKNKTWVLLANAGDSTLLHNTVAYNLALELGMTEATESEAIDLYYDGEYRGSYLLCEKVQVGSGRVDIADMDDANEQANPDVDFDTLKTATATNKYGNAYQYVVGVENPEDITGGYLIEMDSAYYASEKSWFTANGDTYVTKNPEYMSKDEALYISEFFQEALNSLSTGNASDYFDMESLAQTYLINELTKNIDSYCTSTYFYKPQGEDKIYCSPVWDFDTSFGVRNENNSEGIGYTYAGYYAGNRAFMANALKSSDLRSAIQSTYTTQLNDIIVNIVLGDADAAGTFVKSISSYSNTLAKSQSMDQILWGVSNFGNCYPAANTWEENVAYMKNFVQWRNTWLFNEISSWTTSSYSTANTVTVYDGIDYALVFDAKTYLNTYSDLKTAFGTDYEAALEHFVNNGMAEGRQASSNFNVYAYKARYADLQKAFGDDLPAYYKHFIQFGFSEGRTAL